MAAVQGCVSLQKSIGSLAEHKAVLTRAPRDMAATSFLVGVKKPLQSGGSSAFGRISCLPHWSNGSAFLRFHIFPFGAFLATRSSRQLWCVSPSPSLLRNWGIWWDLHHMKYSWVCWMAIKSTTQHLGLRGELWHASSTEHEESTSARRYEQTLYKMEQFFNVAKAQNCQPSWFIRCSRQCGLGHRWRFFFAFFCFVPTISRLYICLHGLPPSTRVTFSVRLAAKVQPNRAPYRTPLHFVF